MYPCRLRKKDIRHGYGKISFFINGKDSIIEGKWVSDDFKGQKTPFDYKIVRKLNVDRYRIHKRSEDAAVYFKIFRGGIPNKEIENLILSSDSLTEVRHGTILGNENLIFPVNVKYLITPGISFITFNTIASLRLLLINLVFTRYLYLIKAQNCNSTFKDSV